MLYKKIHNFLTQEELHNVWEELTTNPQWAYRYRKSLYNDYESSIWRYRPYSAKNYVPDKEVDRESWITNIPGWQLKLSTPWVIILEKILQEYGPNFEICNFTVNGQTKGMNDIIHQDMDYIKRDDTLTSILIYLNPEWKEEWGGHLQYYDQNLKIINRLLPEPGMLIEHDGRCLHQGQGPDIDNLLRVSFACHGAYKDD